MTLLQLIGNPPPSTIRQVLENDNSPGYVLDHNTNLGQLARAHLPNPFYRNFALVFNLKPTTDGAAVIFSVTDVSQKIMYVGVKLSAVQGGNQDVILYYTEPNSEKSYEAARFPVPSMRDTWTRFAIAVRGDTVMFYLNCDTDPLVMAMERSPDEMELQAGTGVFVGHAGGADPDKFVVCAQPPFSRTIFWAENKEDKLEDKLCPENNLYFVSLIIFSESYLALHGSQKTALLCFDFSQSII